MMKSNLNGGAHHLRRALFGMLGALLVLAPARMASAQAATGPSNNGTLPPLPVLTEDNEVKKGREAAEDNDKHVKLVTDAAIVQRVNGIGQILAAAANKYAIPPLWGLPQVKQFQYSFKIVDDKDVNAYSLPGGFIYVNKGLLDFCHSDDELAGVLAHEISHDAHHHMIKLLHEQAKIQKAMMIGMIAGFLIGKPGAVDAGNLITATQLYSIAQLNTYGIEAEKDADHSGILLMEHTKFNPVGLYSFMTRLAAMENTHGHADMGIYRTHPPGEDRVAAARLLLDTEKIPIRLSEVDPMLKGSVMVSKTGAHGEELAEIRMRNLLICRVAAQNGKTVQEQGAEISKKLTTLMDDNLTAFQIKANVAGTAVTIRGVPVLTEADAAAQDKTIAELKEDLAGAVKQYLLKQQLESGI